MKIARLISLVVIGLSVAACGLTTTSQVVPGKKIAFLLPDSTAPRYETQDRPFFQSKLQSVCHDCEVLYRNANGDATAQRHQAESVIAAGANVLVLDAVDRVAASAIVALAAKRHVAVIAYDGLILNATGVTYYVGFDDAAIGALQGSALLAATKGAVQPAVVMLHGDPTDRDANLLKKAVHGAVDGKVTIVKEYDTPSSSQDLAQVEMTQALDGLQNKVDAVYAANDDVASGAVAAMKRAGVKKLPPVTGGNAQLSAVQRILTGEQYMTVYRPVRQEAEAAAELAYDLAFGVSVPLSLTGGKTVNNNAVNLPAVLVQPQAVTRRTLVSTVIADGFWTRADICTAPLASACTAAGIK
ncbi:MAG: substrate-binding domain-containing protein [Candidatus Dormibacteraeota bacterium]|nr:substrate-binding domain-containing protein [Candidatus Dormibacteraeota bacterium]